MRLDATLIKEILLKIEDKPIDSFVDLSFFEMEGYSQDQIRYHLEKLIQAGYVKGQRNHQGLFIEDLTWEGHHFLATLRNDSFMKKAGEFLGRYGLPLLPEFLKYIFIQ